MCVLHLLACITWHGTKDIACVAGVQRGGRGEVECKREARLEREAWSLGARYEHPTIVLRALVALRARIQLPLSLPFVRRPRRLPRIESGNTSNLTSVHVTATLANWQVYPTNFLFLLTAYFDSILS